MAERTSEWKIASGEGDSSAGSYEWGTRIDFKTSIVSIQKVVACGKLSRNGRSSKYQWKTFINMVWF